MQRLLRYFKKKSKDVEVPKVPEIVPSDSWTDIVLDSWESIQTRLMSGSASTPLFSFEGKRVWCKVVSVYDGDTVQVVFPIEGNLCRWKIRLFGIDAPEIRGGTPSTKELAYKSRDWLRDATLEKIVMLECGGWDKYGRLLATIFLPSTTKPLNIQSAVNINHQLIQKNLARRYSGRKKEEWI